MRQILPPPAPLPAHYAGGHSALPPLPPYGGRPLPPPGVINGALFPRLCRRARPAVDDGRSERAAIADYFSPFGLKIRRRLIISSSRSAQRGAPKSHSSAEICCRIPRVWFLYHFCGCFGALASRSPLGAPPPRCPHMAGARRARQRLPLPLGRGCPLSRRRTRRLRSAPPPTPCRGLPASRGLPPPRRESGRFPRVARLPFIF